MTAQPTSGFRRTATAGLIERVVASTPVIDIHAPLRSDVRRLLLWGIDDLLVYHYLAAEALRYLEEPPEKFFA
jgi:hypothetical protein